MSIVLQTESPPLRIDAAGAYRVGDSRVLLEMVIQSFRNGATPESIVQQYPSTTLGDIYAVIGYYLRHRAEVESYLAQRDVAADQVKQKIDGHQGDLNDLRQRLQAHLPQG